MKNVVFCTLLEDVTYLVRTSLEDVTIIFDDAQNRQ